jgi:hypothetical protein
LESSFRSLICFFHFFIRWKVLIRLFNYFRGCCLYSLLGAVYCYSVNDNWELFRKYAPNRLLHCNEMNSVLIPRNVDVGSLRVTAIAFSPNGFYYIVGYLSSFTFSFFFFFFPSNFSFLTL